jgi:hypothetical protein
MHINLVYLIALLQSDVFHAVFYVETMVSQAPFCILQLKSFLKAHMNVFGIGGKLYANLPHIYQYTQSHWSVHGFDGSAQHQLWNFRGPLKRGLGFGLL